MLTLHFLNTGSHLRSSSFLYLCQYLPYSRNMFSYVLCDLEPDIWCEALSSVSSALVALRNQSQSSTILSDFVRFSEFPLLIFQQHGDNISKHFRRTFELHCELIKSKTSVTNANNTFEHVKNDIVPV